MSLKAPLETPASGSSNSTPKLIFQLTVPGRLPSWNAILGTHHWTRKKFKDELAAEFLSALRRHEAAFSIKTISRSNISLTYSATLELFLATALAKRKLKSRSLRLKKASLSKPPSKFLKSKKSLHREPPPF